MDILEGLNSSQCEAVKAADGALMIIAGAGSGKTKVLTHKIAYLLGDGVDAFNILSLTFTNKAATEMKGRITKLIGGTEARSLWMGTFHSVFSKILRIDGTRLGYHSNFTIYDTDASKNTINKVVKAMNLDAKTYTAKSVLGRISAAKTNLISSTDYVNNKELMMQDAMNKMPEVGMIYSIYQKTLFDSNAMDFDDILFLTNVLLRDNPDVLLKYQEKFRYILVDEYQDTNFAQYLILKKLAARHRNICVVGDDAQSIYAFRGANIQNILNFKSDYPEARVIKLEQNYRSTQNIVNAANSLIKHNKGQIQKTVWTDNIEGTKIRVLRSGSDNEEGLNVANAIFEAKMRGQMMNREFAILYRTNSQSRAMEEGLRRLNIPYRIYGGLSFYNRKEIKDALAYFRLVVNNYDLEALLRVINYPVRGIGDTSLNKLIVAANEMGVPLWDFLGNVSNYDSFISSGAVTKIDNFVTMIKSFSARLPYTKADDLASEILFESRLKAFLKEDSTPEGISRLENIEELLNAITEFTNGEDNVSLTGTVIEPNENNVKSLDMFMLDVALLTDQDSGDKEDDDRVTLMTIHAAKGLEFNNVHIVGLEEQLFPSYMSIESRADLEEERRLFYVAITRAERQLTLSYAESRYRYGQFAVTEPSRFIDEIDESLLDYSFKCMRHGAGGGSSKGSGSSGFGGLSGNRAAFTVKMPPKVEASSSTKSAVGANFKKVESGVRVHSPACDLDLVVGMEVEHERFGRGTVIVLSGNAGDRKAMINFIACGEKQLLLKFAKLSII